jgi:hypothetical protein
MRQDNSGSDSGTGLVNSICGLLIADASCADRSPATTRLGSPTAIALSKDRRERGVDLVVLHQGIDTPPAVGRIFFPFDRR